MFGKNIIEIGAADFIKGASTSSDIADGGFSNETQSVNLTATPGVLYGPASAVDADTDVRLTGNVIATSPDMVTVSATNRLLVTDDGKYYTYNGTKIPAAALQTDAVNTYTQGFTDIIVFAGEAYVTTKQTIVRWQSPSTFNNSFLTFTTATVPHPAIVYENNAYYGDKNLLLRQTGAGVAPTTVLTLSADQIIIALGVDPSTGRMLISTTNTMDISAQLTAINRLLWYDGNSATVDRSALIDDVILGFHPVGGTVFVGVNNNVGYVNGSGITWLRKLANVTSDNTELPYKHKMAHIGNTFYVLDGRKAMAYGEVLPGRKVWYPAFYNTNGAAGKPSVIADVGSKKLGFGFATTKFYTLDTTSVATIQNLTFVTNKYTFPRPVYIRGIYLEYNNAITDSTTPASLSYKTQNQTPGFTAFPTITNSSGSSVWEFNDIIGVPGKVKSIQFQYVGLTAVGLRRMLVYYDLAE